MSVVFTVTYDFNKEEFENSCGNAFKNNTQSY